MANIHVTIFTQKILSQLFYFGQIGPLDPDFD